jgi:hypothetical protein
MDDMIFNVQHHWASVSCQALALYGSSSDRERSSSGLLAESAERKTQNPSPVSNAAETLGYCVGLMLPAVLAGELYPANPPCAAPAKLAG